jgi:hypothetical protein
MPPSRAPKVQAAAPPTRVKLFHQRFHLDEPGRPPMFYLGTARIETKCNKDLILLVELSRIERATS